MKKAKVVLGVDPDQFVKKAIKLLSDMKKVACGTWPECYAERRTASRCFTCRAADALASRKS